MCGYGESTCMYKLKLHGTFLYLLMRGILALQLLKDPEMKTSLPPSVQRITVGRACWDGFTDSSKSCCHDTKSLSPGSYRRQTRFTSSLSGGQELEIQAPIFWLLFLQAPSSEAPQSHHKSHDITFVTPFKTAEIWSFSTSSSAYFMAMRA